MQNRNIPKIVVTSKRNFPGWVEKTIKSGESWAYISIEGTQDLVDAGLITDNIHYLPDGPDVLNLEFDDIEEYTEHTWGGKLYRVYPLSEDQAQRIIDFVEGHKEYNLLIHCYAGKSRSVGVAQGIIDLYPGAWKLGEESNPLLTPNICVLRLLHRIGWSLGE